MGSVFDEGSHHSHEQESVNNSPFGKSGPESLPEGVADWVFDYSHEVFDESPLVSYIHSFFGGLDSLRNSKFKEIKNFKKDSRGRELYSEFLEIPIVLGSK